MRRLQPTSLVRAKASNRSNVKDFFDNLQKVMVRHSFEPSDIYNTDRNETGITTVQKPDKVIAAGGRKQIGGTVYQERGTLVTMMSAVNAIVYTVPTMFLFPVTNTLSVMVLPDASELLPSRGGCRTRLPHFHEAIRKACQAF